MEKNIILCGVIFIFLSGSALAGQSCLTSIAKTSPSSRFTDNGDNSVTDNITGLTWKKCMEGTMGNSCSSPESANNEIRDPKTGELKGAIATIFTWQQALQHAEAVNADAISGTNSYQHLGQSNWRLPNIKELASIVEMQCVLPAINTTLFPATHYGYNSQLPAQYGLDEGEIDQTRFPLSGMTWSATPYGNNMAWGISFAEGDDSVSNKHGTGYVRLVRD